MVFVVHLVHNPQRRIFQRTPRKTSEPNTTSKTIYKIFECSNFREFYDIYFLNDQTYKKMASERVACNLEQKSPIFFQNPDFYSI